MTVSSYADEFFGLPIVEFREGGSIGSRDCAYRLMQEYDASQSQRDFLEEFLAKYGKPGPQAIVFGPWGEAGTPPAEYLDTLIKHRLSNLRAVFIGDMTFEDCEISWIQQDDYTAFLAAYPDLEVLRIRGGGALTLPKTTLSKLRELAVETGGLPSSVVQSIADSTFPALKKLELWLGSDNYGFDGNLDTYKSLLAKIRPERLEYLGLRNSSIADEIAEFVAQQSWLATLHTLDLSMGTIGDVGAKALLASPHIRGLKVLNLEHHYISTPLVEKLKALPITLVIDEAEKGDEDDRYVQVSE